MNEKNEKLLNEILEDSLKKTLDEDEVQPNDLSFSEAMAVTDKLIELKKIEASEAKNIRDEEYRAKEAKRNVAIRLAELAAAMAVAPAIEFVTKKAYAKILCTFEETGTFTSTAGRALSSLFKFKK